MYGIKLFISLIGITKCTQAKKINIKIELVTNRII